MAAETSAAPTDEDIAHFGPPPPRIAEGRERVARLVVAVCAAATLWLGFGPALGGFPGVERVIEWAQQAASSLR